jgi:hypothetical protein
MRDFIAGVVALGLLIAAASLATTLTEYRRRRARERAGQRTLGRRIVAEIPGAEDLTLFTEDDRCFYYGPRAIHKAAVVAARVLINGVPIAARSRRGAGAAAIGFEDRPEGIARDRWDVAVDIVEPGEPEGTAPTVLLIECGAIRERVSQELARSVFDAFKREIERTNGL